MPRNNGIYSPPPGTGGTPQTTISSAMFNAWVADITADQNNPRPVIAGGTGAATAAGALQNLAGGANGLHSLTGKTTPVDADELPLVDSASSWGLKQLTWANLKATLKTYYDGLYLSLAGGTMTGNVTMAASTQLEFWNGVGSKILLNGVGYGFGVESGTLNYWGNTTHRFRGGSAADGTILAEIVGVATQAQHLTRKDYVDAAVAGKAGVYTGSTRDETNFPVGHPIACGVSPLPERNAAVVPRVDSGSNISYLTSGTGGILAGTWRSRGNATTGVCILQRTA